MSDRFHNLVIPKTGKPYFTVIIHKRILEKTKYVIRRFKGKVFIEELEQLTPEEEQEMDEQELRRILRGF